MTVVATPNIQAQAWVGLQTQIAAYSGGNLPADGSGLANTVYYVALSTVAFAAVACFTILGINYYNATQPRELDAKPAEIVMQPDAHDILEELRAVVTLDGFNEFVARHNFYATQTFVLNNQVEETQYRLYQRTFLDMTIFTGIRSCLSGIRVVYETAPPGTMPPQNVVVWVNERLN